MASSVRRTAFILASMVIASIVIVVVGVLAITGGTQTTAFTISYEGASLAATIVASGKNGTDDVVMTSDDQITHTATITPQTTNETIPAPSINKGSPLVFKQVNGLPQNIEFYFEVTSNRERGFAYILNTADLNLENVSINLFTGSTKQTATSTYTAGHEVFIDTNGTTKVVKIVLSVIDNGINASASGNMVLSLGEPLNLGTAASPKMVDSLEEFNSFATSSEFADYENPKYYRQATDLTFSAAPTLANLSGSYDGDNHTITITGTNARDAIFNQLGDYDFQSATVQNLNVVNEDCFGTGFTDCGGIVRRNCGIIENCSFTGNIVSSAENTGGICGYLGPYTQTKPSSINLSKDVYSLVAVNNCDEGFIINCYNTGNILANSYAGGICGDGSNGTITNCYNTGNISAYSYLGGISGSAGIIKNCYNTGSLTDLNAVTGPFVFAATSASANVGGISGILGNIINCYNLGIIDSPTGQNYSIGGIKGGGYGTCTGCYWASNTADFGIGDESGTGANNGTTSFDYIANANYLTNNFIEWAPVLNMDGSTWRWKENATTKINGTEVTTADLPHLYWEYDDTDPAGPILNISSVADFTLNAINDHFSNSSLTFAQTTNITITNALILSNLMGTYNGNGFTIRITGSDQRDAIFNELGSYGISTATVQNLNVINEDCVGTDPQYCGGIVRTCFGKIENCSFDGAISFSASYASYIGGICGERLSGSIINNCYNNGSISVTNAGTNTPVYAGGICGDGGIITDCYNTGSVSATSTGSFSAAYAGGICGNDGTIANCYNTSSVTATSTSGSAYAGGICGQNDSTNITNCYNTGSVTANASSMVYAGGICGFSGYSASITNCYNTGSVSVTNTSAFAFAGGISGDSYSGTTITNCYNTGSVTANASSYAYAGGICGEDGAITNCYNLGIVTAPTGTTKYIGGISGRYGTCTSCYWASNTASFGIGTGTNNGTTKFTYNASANYTIRTFAEWSTFFTAPDNVWIFKENITTKINGTDVSTADLPHLNWEYGSLLHSGPLLNISSADDFNYNAFNGYFLDDTLTFNQTANITTTNALLLSDLYGTYNGNGFTIHITGSDQRDAIFNELGSYDSPFISTVRNLNVINDDCVGMDETCGGIVRYSGGIIYNCSFAGSIVSSAYETGGICGYTEGDISNCYNTGSISVTSTSSSACAGGICGISYVTIINCYNTGSISVTSTSSSASAGGICGISGTITNCYNLGIVSATGTNIYVGGISGRNGHCISCYWASNTASFGIGTGMGSGINGGTTSFAYNADANYLTNNFIEWASVLNIDGSTWRWKENTTTKINGTNVVSADLPHLYWEYGDPAPSGPRLNISSADDFNYNAFNGYFLDDTLTFNQTANITTTNALLLSSLYGTYNGNGFTIRITGSDQRDAIFNELDATAIVQNLNVIDDGCVNMDESCGGIVRYNYGIIRNCSFAGSIVSSAYGTGGICGYSSGTIINSYNLGTIFNTGIEVSVGGICGYTEGDIFNCYNTGSITSLCESEWVDVGGICGDSSGIIANCYNTGSVTTTSTSSGDATGGICGYSGGDIFNCYNTGSITASSDSGYPAAGGICGSSEGGIANCYNLGIVSATGTETYIGGICGYNDNIISGCYWASDTASFGIGTGTGTGDDTGATSFAVSGTHSYAQGIFVGCTFGTYGTATTGWVWGASKSMVINGTTFAATNLPRLWWEEL